MSTSEPEVALVFTADPWVEELHRHLSDHGGARVRSLVVEASVALEESYDVLVVSHRSPLLTRAFVGDLHARGRRVLGVHDLSEPASRAHLLSVGVDALDRIRRPGRRVRPCPGRTGRTARACRAAVGADRTIGPARRGRRPAGDGPHRSRRAPRTDDRRRATVLVDCDDVATRRRAAARSGARAQPPKRDRCGRARRG